MNKITVFLLVIMMALCFCLGSTMQSKAQDKTFAGVVPFVTSNDRIGFFDQNSGRIYMYDDNIEKCLYVGQLHSLGQSVETVGANNGNSNS